MEEEINKKSPAKFIISTIFVIFIIGLLIFYWFIPFNSIQLQPKSDNSNFSLDIYDTSKMQFYTNMRYPNSKISYSIGDCTLQKKQNMEQAFQIIENNTILEFYSTSLNPEISVTCDNKNHIEEGMFIAGEGGPSNITITENFNVILNGKILLIRESTCATPNVAIHELFHALGFEHSNNPDNIMYNFTKCSQTIGDDIPKLINELYKTTSYPDLAIENVSASMHGKYLDLSLNIQNHGLQKSQKTELKIYANKKSIKEIQIPELGIGYGTQISINNLWIAKININELELIIDYPYPELTKTNNKINLS